VGGQRVVNNLLGLGGCRTQGFVASTVGQRAEHYDFEAHSGST